MKNPIGNEQEGVAAPAAPAYEPLVVIEGVIDHIVFQNPDNGYSVVKFASLDGSQKFVAVGTLPGVTDSMAVRLTGRWTTHQKFGNQFSVTSFEADLPRSKVGIIKYLTSFISGVGPVMAKRIADKFGEDTVEIIDNDPKKLLEVEGIGRSKLKSIVKSWEEHNRIRSIMMFLQSHNIGPGVAMKIFNTYGDRSIDVLRKNPYLLASQIFGIGFKTADRIAMNLGMDKESPVRLRAGIAYTLQKAADEGHVYLPADELLKDASEMLECELAKAEKALAKLLEKEEEVVSEGDRIYLPHLRRAEITVAERLSAIINAPAGRLFKLSRSDIEIDQAQRALGIKLSKQQLSVIEVMSGKKAVILTGGPGTGKTVSIRIIMRLFENSGYVTMLAAPTGRAAKRMTEATGKQAKTIHRLLEYNPVGNHFFRDENNPLECDFLIVDEMSMVDIILMAHLVRALSDNARVLFVGDADQLPSVGPGNVLRDMIESNVLPSVRLDTIYRQDSDSGIIPNAHLVNKGEMPSLKNYQDGDFFFFKKDDPEEALETLVSICAERLPNRFGLDPIKDIQVISPMHRGVLGVSNLNEVLQCRLNPGRDFTCGSQQFRIGDRVMQIKNNYEKEVFNGDVGFVRTVDLREGSLTIEYPEMSVSYTFKETDQLILAYAITVHKSQGSEYPVVVMPVSTLHYTMLQRNLIYTAITRAGKVVALVGSIKAIAIAVKNNKIEERHTSLKERLASTAGN